MVAFDQYQFSCPTTLQQPAGDVCRSQGFVGASLVEQGKCFK